MNRWEQFNLIMDSDLTQNEKMLLLTIFRNYNHDKGYSYPSKEQIMKTMGLKNESSYYKAKKNLENNHILITKNIKGIGNQYTINYEPLVKRMLTNNKISDLQNVSISDLQNIGTKRKEKIKEKENILLNINESHPYYDYLNGQWMYSELSSELIC